jgi:hypothetical protein
MGGERRILPSVEIQTGTTCRKNKHLGDTGKSKFSLPLVPHVNLKRKKKKQDREKEMRSPLQIRDFSLIIISFLILDLIIIKKKKSFDFLNPELVRQNIPTEKRHPPGVNVGKRFT